MAGEFGALGTFSVERVKEKKDSETPSESSPTVKSKEDEEETKKKRKKALESRVVKKAIFKKKPILEIDRVTLVKGKSNSGGLA